MRRNPSSNRPVHPNKGTEKQVALLESYGWTVVVSGNKWSLTCQVSSKTCLTIFDHDGPNDLLALIPAHSDRHKGSFP